MHKKIINILIPCHIQEASTIIVLYFFFVLTNFITKTYIHQVDYFDGHSFIIIYMSIHFFFLYVQTNNI